MTKKTILMGVIAAGAMMLGGCSDESSVIGAGTGRLAPMVGLDTSVRTPRDAGPASRAGSAAEVLPADEDLSLRLTPDEGMPREWARLADFDASETFKVGNYTLEAWHGTAAAEGFECPYFYGTTPVRIEDGKTTEVALRASLAQTMVTVVYTDAFKGYMTDWSAKVNGIAYTKDETRPVYVAPGKVSVLVDFTKPNGVKGQNYEAASFEALAKTHYTVTIDVNNGNVGDAELVITYDDEMDEQIIVIDISNEVMNAPAPTITLDGAEAGANIEFVQAMTSVEPVSMNIVARGGLKSVTLTTSGISLQSQGWPEEIDLMAATDQQKALLGQLGLEALGLWNNPDQMAVIDFTKVFEHIASVTSDNTTTFTVSVTDRNSKVCDPVSFSATLIPLELALSAAAPLQQGENLDVNLAYNGIELADRVKFQYQNLRATWSDLVIEAVSEPRSRATADYTVTLSGIPADLESVTLRAVCGDVVSETLTVGPAPFELAVSDADIFARHAYVTVNGTEGQDQATLMQNAEFFISADGRNFEAANGSRDGLFFDITALEPGTEYFARVRIDGVYSKKSTFTTEAPVQLPNAGMEEWATTAHKSNCVEYFVGGNVWSTLNPLTLSQVEDCSNVAYQATSGTKSTDGRNGGNAAVIRTVGWGSGNTAAGIGGGGWSTVKHVDRGELFLGDWDGITVTDEVLPNYGTPFAVRPNGLTFWYKYTSMKNHDDGYAEISVLDAAGNVIASNSATITSQSDWQEMTLPLSYNGHVAKAAKLRVIFRSCQHGKPLDGTSMTRSDIYQGSVSNSAEHVGSQLYIDDISLNY